MDSKEKYSIRRNTEIRYMWHRILIGAKNISHSKVLLLLLGVTFSIAVGIYNHFRNLLQEFGELIPVFNAFLTFNFAFMTIVFLLVFCLLYGTPLCANRVKESLLKAGITNYAGEAPVLISKRQDKKFPGITIWEFAPCGIPMKVWEDKKEYIEAAMNVLIADMQWSKDGKYFYLYTAPTQTAFPEKIEWTQEYLSNESFVIILGKSLLGMAMVDLTKIPHILIGGSTGSGKSVLLRLILMQAVEKGAIVHIADFKGGVDFSHVWHEKCDMCFDLEKLSNMLRTLLEVLQERKYLFAKLGCPNLDEYNRLTGEQLARHIVACDEVAEFLDKTGLTKEDKAAIDSIVSQLSTIARLGRAFGIHLILATQRPDANLIPGQIRNNLDGRICGRADNVLSQIILDSTAAADQIPKDSRGRFLTYDGTLFQAFWFEEKNWH